MKPPALPKLTFERKVLALAVGTLAVVPAALIVEVCLHLYASGSPEIAQDLPLIFGGSASTTDAPVFSKFVAGLGMLVGLTVFAGLFALIVGLPLFLVTRRLGLQSSWGFALLTAMVGGSLDQLTSEPRWRGALWFGCLMGAVGGVIHFVGNHRGGPPAPSQRHDLVV